MSCPLRCCLLLIYFILCVRCDQLVLVNHRFAQKVLLLMKKDVCDVGGIWKVAAMTPCGAKISYWHFIQALRI